MIKVLLFASCIFILTVTGQLQELRLHPQPLEATPLVQYIKSNVSLQGNGNLCNRRSYIPNTNAETSIYNPQFMKPGVATRNTLKPHSLKIAESYVGVVPPVTPLKEEVRNYNVKNDLKPFISTNSIPITSHNIIETSTVTVNQKGILERQNIKTKPNADIIRDLERIVKILMDCSDNRKDQESRSNKQRSPVSLFMANTADLKDTTEKHPIILRSKEDIHDGEYELKRDPLTSNNFDDTKATSNTLAKSHTIQSKNLNEESKEKNHNEDEGYSHTTYYDVSNDSYDDMFDDEKLWLRNRRLNNEQIEKKLMDPTKGVVITQLSDPKIMLMQTSRVCYACSTANNPACWEPDRTTTVKYCRKDNDACVTKTIDAQDATILIRDCGNTCDENNLPGPIESYKSCSICHSDLCNGAFSANSHSLMFILFLISLIMYMF